MLIVDDDQETRTAVATFLSDAGATVAEASSASQALEIFRWFAPRVILSDITMPGRDGLDLITEIRRHPRGMRGRLFAIAMTASADPHITERAFAAGFERVLMKPFEAAFMLQLVLGTR